jgi:hypothetical protein
LSLGAGYITLLLTQRLSLEEIRSGRKDQTANTAAEGILQPGIPVMAASAAASMMVPLSPSAVTAAAPAIALPTVNVAAQSCSSGSCQIQWPVKSSSWQFQVAESFRQINWADFGRDALQLSWSLGRWLLLAFTLEALITRYIPQAAIAALLGDNNWFAVPLAALIGIPLYLNNLAALPIVSGLLAQGMQSGAAIAFLIAGPVTTIPAMTAVWGVVPRRVFALYLALGLVGAILLGFIVNLIGL